MRVYLDYIFIINFLFDFMLLMSVKIILRRNISLRRVVLGSLLGGLSIFTLFLRLNSIELFLFKFIISVVMIIATFNFKNIRYTIKNFIFLYLSSFILGGALYFLNIQYSYKQEGMVFFHNGMSINVIVLVIISPIIIYLYIKEQIDLKTNYSNYYNFNFIYKGKLINLNAFLDTGNKLKDPISNLPIIIVDSKKIKIDDFLLVPYHTISGDSMIKCIKINDFEINSKKVHKKIMVGVINNLNMEGIDCILNQSILEGI